MASASSVVTIKVLTFSIDEDLERISKNFLPSLLKPPHIILEGFNESSKALPSLRNSGKNEMLKLGYFFL